MKTNEEYSIKHLNKDLSYKVYKRCKPDLKIKHCYNNTFHVVQHYNNKFVDGTWKVVYGYVRVFDDMNVFCKHAFILDDSDTVIDATLFIKSTQYPYDYGDVKDREYIIMKMFESLDEYILALEEADGYPDLFQYLRDYEMNMYKWAEEQGYLLCG